jgi:hypothetical protein
MLANEVIAKLSNEELYDIVRDLNSPTGVIYADATIRRVASIINGVPVAETNLLQIIGLAPIVALELAHRLKALGAVV